MTKIARATALALLVVCEQGLGQFNSGSDGSDGALTCPIDCTAENACPADPDCCIKIDLSLASAAPWSTPSPQSGRGVYDTSQWAVVFKYSTIDVPEGCHITFKNHPSGAPVVWLARGRVSIAGVVDVSGQQGHDGGEIPFYSEPGPGGFAGSIAQSAGAGGFGPGGGPNKWIGGSYSTPGCGNTDESVYGNDAIMPLIGGSGGSSGPNALARGAGAGGGAILIASGDGTIEGEVNSRITITSTGKVRANGGGFYPDSHGGSGGAIRLMATTVEGPGRLEASGHGSNPCSEFGCGPFVAPAGWCGGAGRIRIEAVNNSVSNTNPPFTFGTPPGLIFPPASAPALRVTHINGVPVTGDPVAGITTQDVEIQREGASNVRIEATNVPEGTVVKVRVVPVLGPVIEVTSSPLKDLGGGVLVAFAGVVFPAGRSEIQLRANW